MQKFVSAGLILLIAAPLSAIDIDPARRTVPEKFINPPSGKRFSIFAGDPERVQKANEVDIKAFQAEVQIEPKRISLSEVKNDSSKAPVMNFSVKNTSKKSYTLSFPDSQRFDYIILAGNGQMVYQWSADKRYVDRIDSVMVNPTEKISYSDKLPLGSKPALFPPGTYTVKVILSNYPEITSEQTFEVAP